MRALHVAIVLTAATVTATPSAHAVETPDLSVYYGTDRATLGGWFGKLAFGGVEAPKFPRAQAGVEVELVRTGRRIDGVDITFPAESCAALESRLAQMWGPPTDDGSDDGFGWSSRSGAQGARFEGNSGFDRPCRLRFFRRVSPHRWLNGSRKSVVPLWAIGKPTTALEAAISVLQPENDGDSIHWQDTAIDGTRVTLTAEIHRNRIVRILVETDLGTDTKRVWRRLLAVFGKPSSAMSDEGTLRWRWRRAPGVELSTFAGTGTVRPPVPVAARPSPPTPAAPPPPPAEPSGFPVSISFGVRAEIE